MSIATVQRNAIWNRILDSLPTALVVVDEGGRVAVANERAAEILGHRCAELEGQALAKVLPGLAASLAHEPELDPAGEARRELEYRKPDGSAVAIGVREVEIEESRGVGPFKLLVFQDITSFRRIRQERDRLLQLAVVSEIMPSVLHELKNPLAAAATALELALEDAAPGALQSDLHAILGELRRALLTLDGVGLMRPSLVQVRHAAVDLALSETFRILESQMRQKRIVGRCLVPALPLLPLDPSVVRALAFNLLNNAIQSCRAGDSIELSARLRSDGALLFTVADTGPGMAPEVLARCRELFFTTKPNGTGLGLALCHNVTRSVGGHLDIRSDPEVGTVVTVVLPVAQAEAPRPSLVEERHLQAQEERCLASRI